MKWYLKVFRKCIIFEKRVISKLSWIFIIPGFLFLFPSIAQAIRAYPFPIEFKQPNGETITIRIHGDEHFHYVATESGYIIAPDEEGYFTYATIADGQISSGTDRVSNSGFKAQQGALRFDSPDFIEKVKQPTLMRVLKNKLDEIGTRPQLRASSAITGNRRGLIILANFSNVKFVTSNSNSAFNAMLNQSGYNKNGATGSARDFYMDNSDGLFTPDFDVFGPVDLPQSMEYYGGNNSEGKDKNAVQMIIDACKAANSMYSNLNFANYDYDKNGEIDNVFVFYAGHNPAEGGSDNNIWPHKSSVYNQDIIIDGVKLYDYACSSELKGNSGTTMAGIGTFTHEFAHVLGLPDLYDADKDENGSGAGIGYWSTMADGPYLNGGNTPPYFSAEERSILGWINHEIITPTASAVTKTLLPIRKTGSNKSFRLNTSVSGEYFVFEVRRKQGWDQ